MRRMEISFLPPRWRRYWPSPWRALPCSIRPMTRVFAAAQQQGKPILVEVWASWCPTCAAQRPILEKLTDDPAFKDLVVFRVDFDAQKPAVRAFGAQMQSTLVVFRGTAERGRSVGDTDAASIRALLEKARA